MRRIAHQASTKEGHQQGLARTLRVPHHTVAALSGKHRCNTFAHRVELVIAGDLLDRALALILEHGEPPDHLQQVDGSEQALRQDLQGQRRCIPPLCDKGVRGRDETLQRSPRVSSRR